MRSRWWVRLAGVGVAAVGVAAIGVAGCGRVGFDQTAPAADAALGAFGAATRISELSDPATRDDDPTLTSDLLEIYFNSERAGGPGSGDIWRAERPTADARWGTPALVAELSSPASETGPEVSADGLTCYFASDRAGTLGATDIWVSTRPARGSAWGAPVHVPELSSTADDTAPAIRADGLALVLESTRGAGDANLWIATRASAASPWSGPQLLAVNTPDHEGSPYPTPDGRSLLYNATRPTGLGEADLFIATRATEADPFGTETLLEISTAANEEDPWLSDDGHILFFASNRTGDVELYEARR